MATKANKVSLKPIGGIKRIDSPLAKYNSTGQLFCVLCNVQVKNEMCWTGHINGKSHRDQMTAVKNKNKPSTTTKVPSVPHKRQAPSVPVPETVPVPEPPKPVQLQPQYETFQGVKRLKLDELKISPMGPPPSILKKTKPKNPQESPLKPPQPQPVIVRKKTFAEIEKEEDMMEVEPIVPILKRIEMEEEEDEEGPEKEDSSNPTVDTSLPPGFFDDAKEDAKARGLEYKNPQDQEWEQFVKEIASEEIKSNTLVSVDEDVSAKDRELDEIEEQMKNWQRVINLERKAEESRRKVQSKKEDEDASMSEGEEEEEEENLEDYDEDLDWRTKKY